MSRAVGKIVPVPVGPVSNGSTEHATNMICIMRSLSTFDRNSARARLAKSQRGTKIVVEGLASLWKRSCVCLLGDGRQPDQRHASRGSCSLESTAPAPCHSLGTPHRCPKLDSKIRARTGVEFFERRDGGLRIFRRNKQQTSKPETSHDPWFECTPKLRTTRLRLLVGSDPWFRARWESCLVAYLLGLSRERPDGLLALMPEWIAPDMCQVFK